MTYNLAQIGTVMTAAFLASLVEAVEALTIVLAVGVVRGWRPALAGAGLGLTLLAVLVAVFGPSLSLIPIAWLQTAIGVLLVLFGMRWLRKAVLRAAGAVPMHDESSAYSSEIGELRCDARRYRSGLHRDRARYRRQRVGSRIGRRDHGGHPGFVDRSYAPPAARGCRKTPSNSRSAPCFQALAPFGSAKATVCRGRGPTSRSLG